MKKMIYFEKESPEQRYCESMEPFASEQTYKTFRDTLQQQFSPLIAQLLIDGGCNQHCNHCFLGLAKSRTLTKVQDIDQVGTALSNRGFLIYPYPAEPLINEAIYHAYSQFLSPIANFMTNGSAPLAQFPTHELSQLFTDSSFRVLYISLHGACAETHERITRTPGSFNATLQMMEKLASIAKEKGLILALNVVVHKENFTELEDIVQLALKYRVRRIYLIRLLPTAKLEFPPSWLMDRQALADTLRIVARLRTTYRSKMWIEMGASWGPNFHMPGIWHFLGRQIYFGNYMHYCFAAELEFAVHPTKREVYPCMIMSGNSALKIGDLNENMEIVYTSFGEQLKNWHREWLTRAKGVCNPANCPYSEICHGGCRGAAISMHFYRTQKIDWFAPFPDCITNVLNDLM